MVERSDRQLQVEADRGERARLDADLAAALHRGGVVLVEAPRPGFAARRKNRLLTAPSTREG
jgi:hypothetical protein